VSSLAGLSQNQTGSAVQSKAGGYLHRFDQRRRESELKGAEFELSYKPSVSWKIDTAFSYLDATNL